jgi:fibronectin type 3 domain-containing protein
MAFRKHVLISVVLLAISGILFGCGDSTVAPASSTDAPIVAPSNVTAQIAMNGDIMIQWDASTQANLWGYNVYRFDNEEGQVGKLNETPLTANSYRDGSAQANIQYEYRVTAVSIKGVESGFSSIVIANWEDGSTKKDPKRHDQ